MISAIPFRTGPSRRDTLLGWFNVAANRTIDESRGRELITDAVVDWCAETIDGKAFSQRVDSTPDAVTLGQHFSGQVPDSLIPFLEVRGIEIIRIERSPFLPKAA